MIVMEVENYLARLKNEMTHDQETIRKFSANIGANDGWVAHWRFGQDGRAAMEAGARLFVRGQLIHRIEAMLKKELPASHIIQSTKDDLSGQLIAHASKMMNQSSDPVTTINTQMFLAAMADQLRQLSWTFAE